MSNTIIKEMLEIKCITKAITQEIRQSKLSVPQSDKKKADDKRAAKTTVQAIIVSPEPDSCNDSHSKEGVINFEHLLIQENESE